MEYCGFHSFTKKSSLEFSDYWAVDVDHNWSFTTYRIIEVFFFTPLKLFELKHWGFQFTFFDSTFSFWVFQFYFSSAFPYSLFSSPPTWPLFVSEEKKGVLDFSYLCTSCVSVTTFYFLFLSYIYCTSKLSVPHIHSYSNTDSLAL